MVFNCFIVYDEYRVGTILPLLSLQFLVAASSLAARFTASPMTEQSNLVSLPILPTIQVPVLTPEPMLMSGSPLSLKSFFNLSVSMAHSIDVLTAISAWFSQSSGAFQNAMIQSPMYLSTVPPFSRTILVIRFRQSLITSTNPSGSSLFLQYSDIGVNPTMSINRKLISFLSPPSLNLLGSFCNSATCLGSRYVSNCFLICCFNLNSKINLLKILCIPTIVITIITQLISDSIKCLLKR